MLIVYMASVNSTSVCSTSDYLFRRWLVCRHLQFSFNCLKLCQEVFRNVRWRQRFFLHCLPLLVTSCFFCAHSQLTIQTCIRSHHLHSWPWPLDAASANRSRP